MDLHVVLRGLSGYFSCCYGLFVTHTVLCGSHCASGEFSVQIHIKEQLCPHEQLLESVKMNKTWKRWSLFYMLFFISLVTPLRNLSSSSFILTIYSYTCETLHAGTAEMWEMQFRNQHWLKPLFFFLWQVGQSDVPPFPELQLSELQGQ